MSNHNISEFVKTTQPQSNENIERTLDNELTFYYGCASGGARKALRKLDEENVMISFMTKNNYAWPEIDNLFIDSGGYSILSSDDIDDHPKVEEYRKYIEKSTPEYYALQDYPCEPSLLNKYDAEVKDHIEKTVNRHIACLNEIPSNIATPVPVIQGWHPDDYVACIDAFRDQGILPNEYVGIGSIKREHDPITVKNIIKTVYEELPAQTKIHGFGAKTRLFRQTTAALYLDSADSNAYDLVASKNHGTSRWEACAIEYLRMKMKIEGEIVIDENQQKLFSYQ